MDVVKTLGLVAPGGEGTYERHGVVLIDDVVVEGGLQDRILEVDVGCCGEYR